jgi:hypothetical protein
MPSYGHKRHHSRVKPLRRQTSSSAAIAAFFPEKLAMAGNRTGNSHPADQMNRRNDRPCAVLRIPFPSDLPRHFKLFHIPLLLQFRLLCDFSSGDCLSGHFSALSLPLEFLIK